MPRTLPLPPWQTHHDTICGFRKSAISGDNISVGDADREQRQERSDLNKILGKIIHLRHSPAPFTTVSLLLHLQERLLQEERILLLDNTASHDALFEVVLIR